jgi:FkbM family methyltransferase
VDNINYLIENTPKDGVLYDIGANTGLLSKKVIEKRPDIHLVMFEPITMYYNAAVEKFKECTSTVQIFNAALSSEDGVITMSVDTDNRGWNTISSILDYGSKELVTGMTLNSVIKHGRIPPPDVIKIDVEQSEYLVILGAREFFKNHLPSKILMEVGITNDHPLWGYEVEMIEYLFSLGYKRFDYNRNKSFDAKFEL